MAQIIQQFKKQYYIISKPLFEPVFLKMSLDRERMNTPENVNETISKLSKYTRKPAFQVLNPTQKMCWE